MVGVTFLLPDVERLAMGLERGVAKFNLNQMNQIGTLTELLML